MGAGPSVNNYILDMASAEKDSLKRLALVAINIAARPSLSSEIR